MAPRPATADAGGARTQVALNLVGQVGEAGEQPVPPVGSSPPDGQTETSAEETRDRPPDCAREDGGFEDFPTDALPAPVGEYVDAAVSALGAPRAMVAAPALAALAAGVGTTRWVELKPGWQEPLIFWIAVIARSGSLKSPGFDSGIWPLRARQRDALAAYRADLVEYERECSRHDADLRAWRARGDRADDPPERPPAPRATRYLASDLTIEALAPLLRDNPRGLLLARNELSGLIRSFDRYRDRGRGGDAEAYLEMFRAGPIIVDRKSHPEPIDVPAAAVSIAGTIQPGVAARVFGGEHRENGLLARFLLSMPPTPRKRWSDDCVPPKLNDAYAALFDRLLALESPAGNGPLALVLSREARTAWADWFNAHAEAQAAADDDLSAARLAKLEAYCARFALLHTLIRNPDAQEVDAEAIRSASRIVRWFLREAERVADRFSQTDDDREDAAILRWIKGRGGRVTLRQLKRGPRRWRRDADDVLTDLAERGFGSYGWPPQSERGGRPSKIFVLDGAGANTPGSNGQARGSGNGSGTDQ